jgi:hypothetical protein
MRENYWNVKPQQELGILHNNKVLAHTKEHLCRKKINLLCI